MFERNVIARLEFELAYYDSAVQSFNHYATWNTTIKLWRSIVPLQNGLSAICACFSIQLFIHLSIALFIKSRPDCYSKIVGEFEYKLSTLKYHIYQPLRSGRIWHKVNFLSGVLQVWIQSFPSPRLVASYVDNDFFIHFGFIQPGN